MAVSYPETKTSISLNRTYHIGYEFYLNRTYHIVDEFSLFETNESPPDNLSTVRNINFTKINKINQ